MKKSGFYDKIFENLIYTLSYYEKGKINLDKKIRLRLICFYIIAILSILSGVAAILLAILSICGIVEVICLKICLAINIGIVAITLFKAVSFLELLNYSERNKK